MLSLGKGIRKGRNPRNRVQAIIGGRRSIGACQGTGLSQPIAIGIIREALCGAGLAGGGQSVQWVVAVRPR